MSSLNDLQFDISELANKFKLTPTVIPKHFVGLPALDAIKLRIEFLIGEIGGYEVLATALSGYTAKQWQNKIEEINRMRFNASDFELLISFFNDSVLIALFGYEHGFSCIDMSLIPSSDYSLADLAWLLKRYQAQSLLLVCDLREDIMDGKSGSETKEKLTRVTQESIILLRQIDIALKTVSNRS
jgi:hypothetical protein